MLSLAVLLVPSAALTARAQETAKTIRDLSGTIPLAVLQRSVGPKFYQSLLVSPLADSSVIRARLAGSRLRDARIIRASENPAYNTLAVRVANELTLVAKDRGAHTRPANSALMHLLVYKIADGFIAVSFAYPEATSGQQHIPLGTVRLSIKKMDGPWTELPSSNQAERGRRLKRIDRMPMDVISVPRP